MRLLHDRYIGRILDCLLKLDCSHGLDKKATNYNYKRWADSCFCTCFISENSGAYQPLPPQTRMCSTKSLTSPPKMHYIKCEKGSSNSRCSFRTSMDNLMSLTFYPFTVISYNFPSTSYSCPPNCKLNYIPLWSITLPNRCDECSS